MGIWSPIHGRRSGRRPIQQDDDGHERAEQVSPETELKAVALTRRFRRLCAVNGAVMLLSPLALLASRPGVWWWESVAGIYFPLMGCLLVLNRCLPRRPVSLLAGWQVFWGGMSSLIGNALALDYLKHAEVAEVPPFVTCTLALCLVPSGITAVTGLWAAVSPTSAKATDRLIAEHPDTYVRDMRGSAALSGLATGLLVAVLLSPWAPTIHHHEPLRVLIIRAIGWWALPVVIGTAGGWLLGWRHGLSIVRRGKETAGEEPRGSA